MSERRARNVDRESGLSRVSRPERKPKRSAPPKYSVDTEYEEEPEYSDSEVEAFKGLQVKDDSRRKKGEAPPKAKRLPKGRPLEQGEEEVGTEAKAKEPEPEPTVTPAQTFLISVAYRTGLITRAYPAESEYVPDVRNMFSVVYHMNSVVNGNSLLHERFPAYTSLGLNAFYAHAFFFHVLRVRNDADLLSRVERRALRRYEQVGPPEAWEIAAPIAGFIQAFGRIVPEGGKYGQIVPSFPNFSGLSGQNNNRSLAGLNADGVGRMPIMPAIQEFLYRYGMNATVYDDDDGVLYPVQKELADEDGRRFLRLSSSAANARDFQALAFSSGWSRPFEYEVDTYVRVEAQKRALIRRWGITEIGDSANLSDLETFLGLEDGRKISWMKELLKLSAAVNKFFPGKTTLAMIPLITRLENISLVTYSKSGTARAAVANEWYRGRSSWKASIEGKVLRDDAVTAYQAAFSTSVRADMANSLVPVEITPSLNGTTTGPYFDAASTPRIEIEGMDQPDPMDQVAATMEQKMYDEEGKQ